MDSLEALEALEALAREFQCAAVSSSPNQARAFWPRWCNQVANLIAPLTPQERADLLARIGMQDVNTGTKS